MYISKGKREVRIEATAMLREGVAVKAAPRGLGVNERVVREWRDRHRAGGYEQLLNRRQYYSAEIKSRSIVYRRESRLSYPQAAADRGIPSSNTLYVWEKLYENQGSDNLQDTRKGRPPYCVQEGEEASSTADTGAGTGN